MMNPTQAIVPGSSDAAALATAARSAVAAVVAAGDHVPCASLLNLLGAISNGPARVDPGPARVVNHAGSAVVSRLTACTVAPACPARTGAVAVSNRPAASSFRGNVLPSLADALSIDEMPEVNPVAPASNDEDDNEAAPSVGEMSCVVPVVRPVNPVARSLGNSVRSEKRRPTASARTSAQGVFAPVPRNPADNLALRNIKHWPAMDPTATIRF